MKIRTPPPELHIPALRPALDLPKTGYQRVKRLVLGNPKDPYDPSLTHHLSLIALLAWVGLGADGLSSSAYGPAEAYKFLGQGHTYLACLIALASAATVFIISYAYSRIIEHFPSGGGGYVVATSLLGETAGVVSGCALLVDYVLTITVSVATGSEAVFSLLPPQYSVYKVPMDFAVIALLMWTNLRGVKESVSMLVPVFMTFLVTHVVLIANGILANVPHAAETAASMSHQAHSDFHSIGIIALLAIFFKSYSMGAGTYTGIEAVSNGLGIMREPQVVTGKRTMAFMATSLAIAAGGLLICYQLANLDPNSEALTHKTLNTVLAENLFTKFQPGGFHVGSWLVLVTIASEAVLLTVAAQTGFIDGPRVMANMATDSWLPHRFSGLSDRLTMKNGILLMGLAAMFLMGVCFSVAYVNPSRNAIDMLVVMYSINVFVTFSLSQFGMCRFWVRERSKDPKWFQHLLVNGVGLVLCASILIMMVIEKFGQGAWLTMVITLCFIGLCILIRRHYLDVAARVKQTDKLFSRLGEAKAPAVLPVFQNDKPTAVLLVKGFNGLGIHSFLSVWRLFPNAFQNVIFLGVGVVDSGLFKGSDQVKALEERTRENLQHYVQLAQSLGIPAKAFLRIGTDVVLEASTLCVEVAKEAPCVTFFSGELLFSKPSLFHKMLHNDTAYAIQRQIRYAGLSMVILPMLIHQLQADASTSFASVKML